jgi:hypothetical protein
MIRQILNGSHTVKLGFVILLVEICVLLVIGVLNYLIWIIGFVCCACIVTNIISIVKATIIMPSEFRDYI